MRALVIGGTGFIGPHVVTRLSEMGHGVAVFHRGRTSADLPAGVQEILCPARVLADRGYYGDFVEEFRRFDPDVVVDMIPVTEKSARTVVDLFRGIARRIVTISSQDVYRAYDVLTGREPGPIQATPLSEDASLRERLFPYRADPPRDEKDPRRWMDDYEKILVERVVMSDPDLPGTVLRLPMVYGPRDKQHRMFEYLKRMQDGRPAILLEEGMSRWRWTRGYVENVAEAVVRAIVDERSAGRVYNVGETDALPLIDWVGEIARAAGWEGEILVVPGEDLPEHLRAQVNTDQNLVVDSARIREELGYQEPIGRDESIARTVAWERAHPPEEFAEGMFDYAAEDAALSGLQKGGRDH